MDWSSWFRRSISRSSSSTNKNTRNPDRQKPPNPRTLPAEDDEKLLGLTDQLVDHVKSFSVDTFKKFPLQDEEDEMTRRTATASAVRNDLSEWQERHATLVLSKVKELAQLRFMLCPRHLKERQFWKIYFMLVKSHVSDALQPMHDLLPLDGHWSWGKPPEKRYKERRTCIYAKHYRSSHLCELRAVQVAKLRRMATENEELSDDGAFEVEMGETRKGVGVGVAVASPAP